jgi:dihydroxyacid dehydratase/phosphogluconate dehydratase
LAGGPIGKVREGDVIRVVIDRNKLEGSVDFVGENGRQFSAARILAARKPREDLAPHPKLPDNTKLWATLQQISGGT